MSVKSRIKIEASHRLRRLRKTPELRQMLQEVFIHPSQLIQPYFLIEGLQRRQPVASMPGVEQQSIDELLISVSKQLELGVPGVMLFGVLEEEGHSPSCKNAEASGAAYDEGLVQQATRQLKAEFGNRVVVFTDTCLCEYTNHGHCGVIKDDQILNDKSVEILAKAAVSQAKAGADFVCPSDMMDGRIEMIRQALDEAGYNQTGILAYAVKYASCFYGPFRDAAFSAPSFGDRKSYQMDYLRGSDEALLALEQSEKAGADLIMVKPALAYLDIVKTVSENTLLPVVAYCVSGEYAMMKAAVEKGWLDETKVMLESLSAIKRAGAQMIVSYDALNYAKWFEQNAH